MNNAPIELRIIDNLFSSFSENLKDFAYWEKYDKILDKLITEYYVGENAFVKYMNFMLDKHPSYTPEWHAVEDVALSLEENSSKYVNKFKY